MKEKPMVTSVSLVDSKDVVVVSAEESPTALRIRDGLLSDARLRGIDISIRVEGGKVVLSGEIKNEDQRSAIVIVARRYVGPNRVVDDLQTPEQASYFCEA